VPRLPTLSPTKLTTYLACPVKFRWTYMDARGKWYLRSKSYYSFGTTLHKALERFHDSGDNGVTTSLELAMAYEESWLEAGFSSAEEMQDAYGEGLEILDRYSADTLTRPKLAKTLYVEKLLTKEMDGFRLVGRVDRVDEHDDGTLEIIDYKTGRQSVSAEDVQTDVAMGVYQLLLKRENPDRRVLGTIMALRSGNQASYEMTEEELNDFERDVQVLGSVILTEDWHDLIPRQKPICSGCDFVPLCKRHEEYDEG
jgi:putative RecB family exonuclease